ncbi:MAG: GNAT family N-acetyltransferase [Bacteroidetes bacterium]|nr:GNAT family N-acetyltransferase [Bacteroidota bacterium]
MKPTVQILPSCSIRHQPWNHCVQQQVNGLIYATTTYLDALCTQWYGIVVNDYEAVMPLPVRKKWGIRYAYTPAFIQQLGLLGDSSSVSMKMLLPLIRSTVSYADIHFNFLNKDFLQSLPVMTRTNLVIPLGRPIEEIRTYYRNDLKENIRKAEKLSLIYSHASIHEAVTHFREQYGSRMQQVQPGDYQRFLLLCEDLQSKEQCLVRSVRDQQGGLLAIALLLKDSRRIYNLMNTTLPRGRHKEANHWLIDQIIQEFSGQPFLLDMEGSELPGVKNFYESFGAVAQPYFHYHDNRLPWPLRWLKR